jgi:hypothetical protein
MSKPFSFGRDPRVDEILTMICDGKLSRESARTALLNIGLEQFNEEYEHGNASERQARALNTSKLCP